MPYLQIVYASRPFGFDAGTLIDILFKARAKNARADVTGCLICRDDIYLQLLEGPAENVTRIYKKIREDDRHVEVTQLVRHGVPERMFGAWAMRDDPVQSWMWELPPTAITQSVSAQTATAHMLSCFLTAQLRLLAFMLSPTIRFCSAPTTQNAAALIRRAICLWGRRQ